MSHTEKTHNVRAMKGRDRNAPCWCKSGRKYKKCHLARDAQPKENPWDVVSKNRKSFTKKKCCANGVGLGSCGGGVIKAHTVSRGSNLASIAKDGHVMCYRSDITDMNRNGGHLSVKRIGTKEASVFYGFCRDHDLKLFSCIENEPVVGRPDQLLVVAYRTLSRELYGKDAAEPLREILRGADKGRSLPEQILHQDILDLIHKGNEAARQDLKLTHDALTSALVDGMTDIIRSCVIEFSGTLPFMFSGAWSPTTDLYGNKLQDSLSIERLEQVIFSSFAQEDSATVCVSWRDTDNAPGKTIADQINELPLDQQATACLQIVAKHVENIFYNPDWFQGLDIKQRAQMDHLAVDGMDLLGSPPSAPVRLSMDFGLPAASRSFCV